MLDVLVVHATHIGFSIETDYKYVTPFLTQKLLEFAAASAGDSFNDALQPGDDKEEEEEDGGHPNPPNTCITV